MKSLNQSFLLLSPQLEKLLQTKYLPDPEIFSSLTLEACFDYFHRKEALVNFTKLKEKELFNINPLIENKIQIENICPKEVKYNRFVDVLEILNKNRFKDNNNETNNQASELNPESLEKAVNSEVDIQDKVNKISNIENVQVSNLANDSNIESNNNGINGNSDNAEAKGSDNINPNKNENDNGRPNTKKKKVPYCKIIDENVDIKSNKGKTSQSHKGMLVQLRVRDEIINGIILENNKIQCAFKGCEKIFKNKYKLKDHLVTHSNNKKFTCSIDECRREFKRRQTLNRHIRSFHQKITKHSCKFCSVVFTNFNSLLYHERKFHTNYLPYKCVFRGKINLINLDCDKAFAIKSSLVSHVRQFHKIEPNKEKSN